MSKRSSNTSGKLLNHPDREKIIKQLLDGQSAASVANELATKYPKDNQSHLRISTVTLADFRNRHLQLSREAVRVIREENKRKALGLPYNENLNTFRNVENESDAAYDIRVKETLLQSATYRQRLHAITEAAIDGPRLVKELVTLIQSRLEVYFNEIASASDVGTALKADKQFAEYVSLMKDLVKDAKKIETEYNSQPEAGSVQLNVVQDQIAIIRDIVRNLLAELHPDIALQFMDKLHKKMAAATYQPPPEPNVLKHVQTLNRKIDEIKQKK